MNDVNILALEERQELIRLTHGSVKIDKAFFRVRKRVNRVRKSTRTARARKKICDQIVKAAEKEAR